MDTFFNETLNREININNERIGLGWNNEDWKLFYNKHNFIYGSSIPEWDIF